MLLGNCSALGVPLRWGPNSLEFVSAQYGETQYQHAMLTKRSARDDVCRMRPGHPAIELEGDQFGELGRDVGHRHFCGLQAVSRGEHGADIAERSVRCVMHDGNELVSR